MGMKKGVQKVRKSQKMQGVGRPGAGGIVIEKPKVTVYDILMTWEHGNLKTDTSIYYSTT